MSELDLLLVLGAAALAAALAWLALRATLASVPLEDRRWRDRPPIAWRIGWPALRPLAALLSPVLPPRWRAAQARMLRQGGLDLALDAAHVSAACLLAALALAGATWLALDAVNGAATGPAALAAAGLGLAWPLSWLRRRRDARLRAIARALPFYLDVVTLSVESGANLTGALRHAVAKGPAGPLRTELERVLRDVQTGRPRADALRAMADRLELPAVGSWVAALVAAERHGAGLGPILRAQAEQRREERFQQAEKAAMKAPVKMLFPLLVFIFPCTFVLLGFPVVVRLLEEGLLR
ncbi:MAG: type II secretion system F family protein [Burkholderiaceae bacterium]|jgi:tight adherence protein C|nr:type II secretion system F family protein [Burkholderiales bacterium]MCZ8104757.1 type II secretion system F family protein [Burkholderiales bacterium]MCZ8337277.1 type II secretion system F family protein [Burkholderiaceae bacterium]